MTQPYFRARDGRKIYYADISERIATEHPELVGAHILPQLEALGLYEEMRSGETPCMLPYSFSEKGAS